MHDFHPNLTLQRSATSQMATVLKRNSSSEIHNPPRAHEEKPINALARVNELMAAWHAGLLDTPDTLAATMEQFFSKDLI